MKVISLISSHRKNGNTERLISLVEEELQSVAKIQNESLEIERISIGHAVFKICLGCRVCFEKGEEFCPLKDNLLPANIIFAKPFHRAHRTLCRQVVEEWFKGFANAKR